MAAKFNEDDLSDAISRGLTAVPFRTVDELHQQVFQAVRAVLLKEEPRLPLAEQTKVVITQGTETVDRATLIKALIEGDVQTNSGERDWYLCSLLMAGNEGYIDMSDRDLLATAESALSLMLDPSDIDGDAPESATHFDIVEIRNLAKLFDERGVL